MANYLIYSVYHIIVGKTDPSGGPNPFAFLIQLSD
jgi:hypothetical protein